MYVMIDGEYADAELGYLQEFLAMLDSKISGLENGCVGSDGPRDKCEYFIGLGFVAMQQYMIDTLGSDTRKAAALELGPVDSRGDTVVSAINAAANWWKHSSEWPLTRAEELSANSARPAARTREIVSKSSESTDFPLSNLLAWLSKGDGSLALTELLPSLVQWRAEVEGFLGK